MVQHCVIRKNDIFKLGRILVPAGVVFTATILIYWYKGLAPFGMRSLAWQDAYFQYLDFFGFYKDVLEGKNSIAYTLSDGLGKTGIGLWAYYLASPFNLLLFFFKKNQLNAFLDIVIALKMGLCAATMSFFLEERFHHKLQFIFQLLLGVSYAWMQYNWAQCSNVMWLDGVYMLPLMLLGVYKLVWKGKKSYLPIVVAVSIVFQWYTAGINCLFASLWFCFELLLNWTETKKNISYYLKKTIPFVHSMLTGVFMSCVVFLPVIFDLRDGKGSFDWNRLYFSLRGNILSAYKYNIIGGISTGRNVCLFCGGLTIIAGIGIFTNRYIALKTKIIMAFMFAATVLIYYWQPLFLLFSLLKGADSYYFRYSYVTIFFLIFLGGYYFSLSDDRRKSIYTTIVMIFYILGMFVMHLQDKHEIPITVWGTEWLLLFEYISQSVLRSTNQFVKKAGVMLLCIGIGGELSWNALALMKIYHFEEAQKIDNYNGALENQIRSITENDNDYYRMTQTSSKEMQHLYVNYCASFGNALAHDYAGIALYNSCPDNLTQDFLNDAGYRVDGGCVTIVNTSILPLDSLLGVRYILSPYDIKGYIVVQETDPVTQMKVYSNPYELPLAFTAKYADVVSNNENPFEYVNDLYSSLDSGKEVNVFMPVTYEVLQGTVDTKYTLSGISKESLVYGNIPWKVYDASVLDVNGVYNQYYTGWLSPSVFFVPLSGGEAYVNYHHEGMSTESPAQFYQVDFPVLEHITKKLQNNAASVELIGENKIHLTACGEPGEMLILTVPYHEGWDLKINGTKASFEKVAGAFIGISLTDEMNKIEMEYHIPGFKGGIVASLVGLLMLFGIYVSEKKTAIKSQV